MYAFLSVIALRSMVPRPKQQQKLTFAVSLVIWALMNCGGGEMTSRRTRLTRLDLFHPGRASFTPHVYWMTALLRPATYTELGASGGSWNAKGNW